MNFPPPLPDQHVSTGLWTFGIVAGVFSLVCAAELIEFLRRPRARVSGDRSLKASVRVAVMLGLAVASVVILTQDSEQTIAEHKALKQLLPLEAVHWRVSLEDGTQMVISAPEARDQVCLKFALQFRGQVRITDRLSGAVLSPEKRVLPNPRTIEPGIFSGRQGPWTHHTCAQQDGQWNVEVDSFVLSPAGSAPGQE